jgi:type VI protein secretion system component VasK
LRVHLLLSDLYVGSMATMAWTDDKIDVLAKKVDDGFARMDERFTGVEVELAKVNGRVDGLAALTDERFKAVGQRFDEVDRRLDRLDAGFVQMNDKFDALQRTLLQLCGGLIGTVIAAAVALILAHGG